MAKEKTYKINSSHNSRNTVYEGTMEYLTKQVFGYTLECGHSWDNKIKRFPKTGKSLVTALNQSANICNRYNDYYSLIV